MNKNLSAPAYPYGSQSTAQRFFYIVALTVILWVAYIARISTIFGDAVLYRSYYNQLSNIPLNQLMSFTNAYIGAPEPVVPFIYWIGAASGISLITISFFASTALLCLLALILWRHRVPVIVLVLIALSLYTQVMITNADRLKFGVLFFLMSLVFKTRARWVAGALAVGSHYQLIFFYAPLGVSLNWRVVYEFFKDLKIPKSIFPATVFGALILIAFAITTQSQLQEKLEVYLSLRRPEELLQVLLAAIIMLTAVKQRAPFLAGLTVLAVAILFLGGQRLNLVVYVFIVLWYFSERKTLNLQIIVFLGYFSVRGCMYFMNTLRYGSGYTNLPAIF